MKFEIHCFLNFILCCEGKFYIYKHDKSIENNTVYSSTNIITTIYVEAWLHKCKDLQYQESLF